MIQILCQSKLTVQLLQRYAVIFQKEEAVISDSLFDFADKVGDDDWIIRIQLRQVDRLQLRKVVCFLGRWWRNPFWKEDQMEQMVPLLTLIANI